MFFVCLLIFCVTLILCFTKQKKKITKTSNYKAHYQQKYIISLFRKKYNGGAVRSISVFYSSFVDENITILSLFDDPEEILKKERLQTAIDAIRSQFGFTTLQKANSLTSASRSIARSKLVGGHSAGGLDGLK